MLRAVIADVLGIANIATDIADIADVVNVRILRWKQVGAYEVLPRCLLYKAVPPPPRSGCCCRLGCRGSYCCC